MILTRGTERGFLSIKGEFFLKKIYIFSVCVYRLSLSHRPPAPTGDPLQRLPEDPSVQSGHVAVRGMLPERGLGGGGPLFAPECRD